MNDITLFMAPGTCARVTAIALEHIGVPFETRVVRFMTGEHKSPDYLRLNPKGKVPALVIGDDVLTENVAIITYLNASYPDSGLMPPAPTASAVAHQLADLCFCASTLHPLVTRIRMPQMFATPEVMRIVRDRGREAMQEFFRLIDERLREAPWWYGAQWSAMDAYLYWVFWRVDGAGFDIHPYPGFTRHARAMEALPAVQRAIAREDVATAQLKAEGLQFMPPPIPDQHSYRDAPMK